MQRSGSAFSEGGRDRASGELGEVTFVRTWNYGNAPQEGIGNPPDAEPPPGLDWDMWLGPAPEASLQRESLRRRSRRRLFSHFRWFWDYAGGMMTDWGVHWLDIVQMAFNEAMPTIGHRCRRQVLAQGQPRDAGHDPGHLRVSRLHRRLTKTGTATRNRCFRKAAACFSTEPRRRCSSTVPSIA